MSEPKSNNNEIPIDLSQLDQLSLENITIVSLQTQLAEQKTRN